MGIATMKLFWAVHPAKTTNKHGIFTTDWNRARSQDFKLKAVASGLIEECIGEIDPYSACQRVSSSAQNVDWVDENEDENEWVV